MNPFRSMLLAATVAIVFLFPISAFTGEKNTFSQDRVVGTLHVDLHGNSEGRPVILIPGLGSGAWVWEDTIKHFESERPIYALTLAGFDGTPAPEKNDDLFVQAQASLQELIREDRINKPILIGHSLGGTLAIAFASRHPELVGGVVAVDGLPIFPGFEQLSEAQRMGMARRMGAMYDDMTAEEFAAQQEAYMQMVGVLDPDLARRFGALQARSNPSIVGTFTREALVLDLRPELANLKVPLLEIVPWNKPDSEAAAEAGKSASVDVEQRRSYYASFLEDAPKATVKVIAPARHFVMLDQPQAFLEAVSEFIRVNDL